MRLRQPILCGTKYRLIRLLPRRIYVALLSWFCAAALIVVLGAIPIDDGLSYLLGGLSALLLLAVLTLGALFCALRRLIMRRWISAAVTTAVSIGMAASVFLAPAGIFEPAVDLNQLIHFAREKPQYDSYVLGSQERPHLQVFMWEIDFVGGSGVVYDDSDGLALPRAQRSKVWFARATHNDINGALASICRVRHAWSHYYIVSFGCNEDPK